jgi:hypothetical protein
MKIAKCLFFTFCLLVSCWSTALTQSVTLNGEIYDSESNSPVAYVSIGSTNDHQGTASNVDGAFEIKVKSLPVKLIFNHLSYERDTVLVSDQEGLITVKLDKSSVILEELVHRGDDYVTTLLKNAYEKLHRDFDKNMYADAFYRQMTHIDSEPTEVQEIIYQAKMNSSRVIGTHLSTGRYAANKDAIIKFTNFSVYFKMFGLTDQSESDRVSIIHPRAREKYEMTLDRFILDDGDEIAEISFKCKSGQCTDPMSGVVYIDTQNYGIRNIMVNILGSMNFEIKSPFVKYDPENFDFNWRASFRESEDSYILDYIKVDFDFDLVKRKEKHPVSVSSLTYFYNPSTQAKNVKYEPANPKVNDRDTIRDIPYDPDFWENNEIIDRTPLEENLISSFEQKGSFGTMISK